MATIDQADIRGSRPHNHDPSGAASDYSRESGQWPVANVRPRVLLRACSGAADLVLELDCRIQGFAFFPCWKVLLLSSHAAMGC